MPLFLGQLKARPPNRYSAVLSYRPDKPSKEADAILALNMGAAAQVRNAGSFPIFLNALIRCHG